MATDHVTPHIEAKARELYEDARRRVSGRPPWERLNPADPYDMGMRSTAIENAKAALLQSADDDDDYYRPDASGYSRADEEWFFDMDGKP